MCQKFLLTVILFLFVSSQSFSNERKFGYIYQSVIMGKGEKELELWTTPRLGKDRSYYARMDNRVEFETGISNKLQGAFYINFRNITTENQTGDGVSTVFKFQGISTELKYQLSDPVTNALGFALYGELGLNTDEVELETKLIFDKKIGKTTLAMNIVAEPEWHLGPGQAEMEFVQQNLLGLSYSISSSFAAGIEVRNSNVFAEDEGLEHSALFAGPVISFSQPAWWMTLTVLPQVQSFKDRTGESHLDLSEFEKLEARLLLAFHL